MFKTKYKIYFERVPATGKYYIAFKKWWNPFWCILRRSNGYNSYIQKFASLDEAAIYIKKLENNQLNSWGDEEVKTI